MESKIILSKHLERDVKIWYYFPENYKTNKPPIMLYNDGQDILERWGFENLYFKKHLAVMVEHGGINRINEFSPWLDTEYGGGNADKYLAFIDEELLPWLHAEGVDTSQLGMLGSSLGGLFSLYAGTKMELSMIGAMSPSVWFGDCKILNHLIENPLNHKTKLHLSIGGKEPQYENRVKNLRTFDALAIILNEQLEERQIIKYLDHAHNPHSWSQRLRPALDYLLNRN